MYIGDSTNNYSNIQFTQASNFYTIGATAGGAFSFVNGANNAYVFTLNSDASGNVFQIGAGNKVNFNASRMGIGGYSNIYTIPNPLTVIGATSISTVETGLTPSNSSSVLLSLNSITQGFLMPRMTTTQINAISSPDTGLEVYNTTLQQPCFYDGTGWRKVSYSTM
jgi:hypothetical protein